VPFGPLSLARRKHGVAIHVESNGTYGRFVINEVLGRIDCPAEPVLAYSKAIFHAYTSSVAADPLTGRTGTEEALAFLRSAKCQPSTALNSSELDKLQSILRLSPRRNYYPPDLKKLQEIHWDPDIPYHSQHEEFRLLVEEIHQKHEELSLFHSEPVKRHELKTGGDRHLLYRGLARRNKLGNGGDNGESSREI